MYQITSYKYINNNSNTTILFLHGWGCNYKYFDPIVQHTKKYNCLLIDLPGFGNNEPLKTPITIYDYERYILNFLNEKNKKIDFIVAHSFGGKLSILLANKLKCKAMVLFAPSLFNCRNITYYVKVYFYKFLKLLHFPKKILNMFGSKDYKSLNDIMKKTMIYVINVDIKQELKEIDTPVLLIFGNKDKITPIKIGYKAKKNMPNGEVTKIKGDHFAYLQNIDISTKIIESMVDYYA